MSEPWRRSPFSWRDWFKGVTTPLHAYRGVGDEEHVDDVRGENNGVDTNSRKVVPLSEEACAAAADELGGRAWLIALSVPVHRACSPHLPPPVHTRCILLPGSHSSGFSST
jgi:hypothetical protein